MFYKKLYFSKYLRNLFIEYLVNKYWLNGYNVIGNVLGINIIVVNKIDMVFVYVKFIIKSGCVKYVIIGRCDDLRVLSEFVGGVRFFF